MEALLTKIFNIDYRNPWSDGGNWEESKIYLALQEQTQSLQPSKPHDLLYRSFDTARKILAIEFLREDNHGFADADTVSSSLERNIENLHWDELIEIAHHSGIFYKLRTDESDDNFFLTGNEAERIHYRTVCRCVLTFLLEEISIPLAKLKMYLSCKLPDSFWHELYKVEEDDGRDRIDGIVESILR